MKYIIKAFMNEAGNTVCRFKALMPSLEDVAVFLERVRLDAYDHVKVVPKDYENDL